eukprot:4362674-Amphidinium_carterae.1
MTYAHHFISDDFVQCDGGTTADRAHQLMETLLARGVRFPIFRPASVEEPRKDELRVFSKDILNKKLMSGTEAATLSGTLAR